MESSVKLTPSARMLVQNKLLSQNDAARALLAARKQKIPFVSYLVTEKILPAPDIALCFARQANLPLLDLEAFDSSHFPKNAIDEKLIKEHHIFPLLQQKNTLYVAMSDPNNEEALEKIRFKTGSNILSIIVEDDKLNRFIEAGIEVEDKQLASIDGLDNMQLDSIDISEGVDEIVDLENSAPESSLDDPPIVRFVNKIIVDAIKIKASDIHFEPYESNYRIRYRLDGLLKEIAAPPIKLAGRLAARLKVMADLDISEKRLPQDGRFKMKLSAKRSVGFRINSCPTLFGEKIVLRILDPSMAAIGIEKLGFEKTQRDSFERSLAKPQGMILVTGPTGSGKTVTLYTALNLLNSPDANISTVEEPVEIYLQGINQVNVNNKAGLDFATALRSFLRQDPDVIMVGEIRDTETAEIGIKAAQTGHLVLSTLHTNSAAETLTRLVNMNVATFNIATSVSLVIAQRLIRRLCDKCRQPIKLSEEVLKEEGFTKEDLENLTIYEPKGCQSCHDGYHGRIGIYEILPITDAIGRIIMSNGSSIDIAECAKKSGMVDLRRAGLLKVMRGISSLQEVNRATKD